MRKEPVTRTLSSPLSSKAASMASPIVGNTPSTLPCLRTVSASSPHGSALGESGCVTYIAEHMGANSDTTPSASLSLSIPITRTTLP